MDLYFVRHGIAAERGTYASDFDRPLVDEGVSKMKAIGKALKKLGARPDMILTSPLVRARETAEIVAKALAVEEKLMQAPELACGCGLRRLAKLLEAKGNPESVMVVGHEPDFSVMIGELIGTPEVEMKKGAVALVRVSGKVQPNNGTLAWLKPPKQLVAIALG